MSTKQVVRQKEKIITVMRRDIARSGRVVSITAIVMKILSAINLSEPVFLSGPVCPTFIVRSVKSVKIVPA
jgi:hypothetical protein